MSFGIWQIVLIVLIVVLVFGAGKIPRVMGDFAKGIKSFKAGMRDGETGDAASAKVSEPPAQANQNETKVIDAENVAVDATVDATVDAGNVKKDETAKTAKG